MKPQSVTVTLLHYIVSFLVLPKITRKPCHGLATKRKLPTANCETTINWPIVTSDSPPPLIDNRIHVVWRRLRLTNICEASGSCRTSVKSFCNMSTLKKPCELPCGSWRRQIPIIRSDGLTVRIELTYRLRLRRGGTPEGQQHVIYNYTIWESGTVGSREQLNLQFGFLFESKLSLSMT